MPNSENPGHFKDVFDTYMYNKRDTGEAQPVDEFASQSCKHTQKKLFTPDNICISVKDKNGIVSNTIEEEHVTAYVQRVEEQKACALIRAKKKKKKEMQ